jgi:protease II
MIDLLGTKKEYCLLVKNLSQGQNSELQPRAIFNIRPQAVFSGDGKSICYVQRSPEGGWIELAYRPIESCWKKKGDLARIDEEN